jgi:hypothetical protein
MHASNVIVCSNPATQKHNSGLSLPLTDVELPGHGTQDVFEIAASVMPYLFTSHNVQAWPYVSLYVPAEHYVQRPQSNPEYPESHLQFCKTVLATRETEFTGHAEQLAEPIVSL